MITAIIVAKGLETKRVAPIFQKGGILTTDRIKRIGRAEGMIRMREEMRKVKNQRIKLNNRNITKNDFEDMELRTKRRRDCSRLERGVLKSDQIDNKYVQDRGAKIQVVGSDVEALYPSLEAVEVAEIVYNAVMETKIKFENIDWMEGCKYIALTSTAQECRLGPLRRVLPRKRFVPGTRPGITGEDPWVERVVDRTSWSSHL